MLPNSPHQGTEHIWMRFSLDTEELSSYRNSAPILQMEVRGPVRVRWNNQTVYPINDTVHTNNWMAADRATRAPVWHALLINVPVPAHLIQSRNIIEIDVESFYLYRGGVRSVRLSPARVALQFGPNKNVLWIVGVWIGIFFLAGLFNGIIYASNPRNTTHLLFWFIPWCMALYTLGGIPGLSSFAVDFRSVLMYVPVISVMLLYVIIPTLLYLFFRRLFRSGRARSTHASGAFSIDRSFPFELSAAVRLLDRAIYALAFSLCVYLLLSRFPAVYGNHLHTIAVFFSGPVSLFTLIQLMYAAWRKQPGALLAFLGFTIGVSCVVLGIRWNDFYLTGLVWWPDSLLWIAGGFGFFVLSMVFVLGVNRYRMHRDMSFSRDVLRESNLKLQETDRQKNRYILSNARELQNPLKTIQKQCMLIIDDPSFRSEVAAHPNILETLNQLMELSARMLKRTTRVVTYFEDLVEKSVTLESVRPLEFIQMLKVLYQTEAPELRIHIQAPAILPELRANRDLLKMLFDELIDNALRHRLDSQRRIGMRVKMEAIVATPESRSLNSDFLRFEIQDRGLARVIGQRGLAGAFAVGSTPDPGIGLGFSLVRRIVEVLGGKMENPPEASDDFDSDALMAAIAFRLPVNKPATRDANRQVLFRQAIAHIQFLNEIGA
ncbi:MAG: hypothetical protein KDK34_13145, partial [Leptospiraceae bacterium]|nr:hypothetical protein [Leptospiraceae bacterium]